MENLGWSVYRICSLVDSNITSSNVGYLDRLKAEMKAGTARHCWIKTILEHRETVDPKEWDEKALDDLSIAYLAAGLLEAGSDTVCPPKQYRFSVLV